MLAASARWSTASPENGVGMGGKTPRSFTGRIYTRSPGESMVACAMVEGRRSMVKSRRSIVGAVVTCDRPLTIHRLIRWIQRRQVEAPVYVSVVLPTGAVGASRTGIGNHLEDVAVRIGDARRR